MMKIRMITSLALLFVCCLCKAQINDNNTSTQKIKKYSPNSIITTTTDSIKSTTVTNSRGVITSQEHFKGDEPVGKWMLLRDFTKQQAAILDYDFKVKYGDPTQKRPDSNLFIKSKAILLPLTDNDSLGYKAPKIANEEKTLNNFVQKNIAYPSKAIQRELQGKVYVRYVVTETGEITDIEVIKGINILLDKEAVRLVRLLKFSNAAQLNGENKKLSLVLPVDFRLEY